MPGNPMLGLMTIEYLEKVKAVHGGRIPEDPLTACFRWGAFMDDSEDGLGTAMRLSVDALGARQWMAYYYSFAIPSPEALETIAKYGPIVELGAGNGYWAHELQKRGVDVLPYDIAPLEWKTEAGPREDWIAEYGGPTEPPKLWTGVEEGDEHVLTRHPDRTLLMVWPSYDVRWAYDAARIHAEAGGTTLIYVGEWGGCTADEQFHALLDRDYETIDAADIPQWFGIHDRLWVMRRKEA